MLESWYFQSVSLVTFWMEILHFTYAILCPVVILILFYRKDEIYSRNIVWCCLWFSPGGTSSYTFYNALLLITSVVILFSWKKRQKRLARLCVIWGCVQRKMLCKVNWTDRWKDLMCWPQQCFRGNAIYIFSHRYLVMDLFQKNKWKIYCGDHELWNFKKSV